MHMSVNEIVMVLIYVAYILLVVSLALDDMRTKAILKQILEEIKKEIGEEEEIEDSKKL